jgi:Tfp pilus assembly PilM family ATPase
MGVSFNVIINRSTKGFVLDVDRANRKKKGETKSTRYGLSTLTEVTNHVTREFKRHLAAERNFSTR